MTDQKIPRRRAVATDHGPSRGASGFSLLEVILALAILAGAVAVLGEVARHGLESTRIARDLTYAQLLCESKLAEIALGVTPPDPVDYAPIENTTAPTPVGWLYSIEVASTDIDGLLAVRVTVTQDLPEEQHPVQCSLTRWVGDPDAEAYSALTEEASASSSPSGTGMSSTGTNDQNDE